MGQDQIKNDRNRISAKDLIFAVEMTIACAISYSIMTSGLVRFVDKPSDFLGGMWAVIATVFVFRDSRSNSMSAALSRLIATCIGIASLLRVGTRA
jgi:hypothetical protein